MTEPDGPSGVRQPGRVGVRRSSLALASMGLSQSFMASALGLSPSAEALPTDRAFPGPGMGDTISTGAGVADGSVGDPGGSRMGSAGGGGGGFLAGSSVGSAGWGTQPKTAYSTDIELTADEFQIPGILTRMDGGEARGGGSGGGGSGAAGLAGIPDPPSEPRKLFGPAGVTLAELRAEKASEDSGRRKAGPGVADLVGPGPLREINFADVVDIDPGEAWENYVSHDLVGQLVESVAFRLGILAVIILNSVLIGVQTDEEVRSQMSGILSGLDSMFLIVFVVEIGLKWYHGFMRFWLNSWNIFDLAIVAASLLGPSLTFVSSGRVLRILRVVRAFRSLRSISALQGLQVIVQTILQSLPDMLNILLLLLIMAFIFAVVGVTVFGESVPQHFGSLGDALFSLFIIVTQDGWIAMFNDLEDKGLFVSAALYFAAFIVVGSFVLANVFVGVVVTNLQVSYEDIKRLKRAQRRSLVAPTTAAVMGAASGAAAGAAAAAAAKGGNATGHAPGSRPLLPFLLTPDMPPSAWRAQNPLELPDNLLSLPVSTLENYIVLVAAMESAMEEYAELRSRLHAAADTVREVNQLHRPGFDDDDDDDDDDASFHTTSPRSSRFGSLRSSLGAFPSDDETSDSSQGSSGGHTRSSRSPQPHADVLSRQIRAQQQHGSSYGSSHLRHRR